MQLGKGKICADKILMGKGVTGTHKKLFIIRVSKDTREAN